MLLMFRAVNQRFPMTSDTIPLIPALTSATGYLVKDPSVVTDQIELVVSSLEVIQSLPSGPEVIICRTAPGTSIRTSLTIVPDGAMLVTAPRRASVNQMFPSGPLVMPFAWPRSYT